jgi:aminoglycoside 6'-N-acetyltransferase I
MESSPNSSVDSPIPRTAGPGSIRLTRELHDADWRHLRAAFIPEVTAARHTALLTSLRANHVDFAALIACDDFNLPVGLCEISIRREYVNGCLSSPVLYLEGLYVDPTRQRQGYARRLCQTAMDWGRTHGCKEFASDVDLDNTTSLAVHAALGFRETGRVVFFCRSLVLNDKEHR